MNNRAQDLIKRITPELAQSILSEHKNYRKINKSRVAKYAELMQNKKWKLSILLFDNDGKLCDGQHRLLAVIKNGVAQQFVCISGWPTEDIIAIDNGQGRTRTQVLISERGNIKYANVIIALVTALEYGVKTGGRPITNLESVEAYDKYAELAEDLAMIGKGPFRSAISMVAFAKAILANPERKPEILNALSKASELVFDEPRMAGLRQFSTWFMTYNGSLHGGNREEVYLRCARAVKAFIDGEQLDKLHKPSCDPFK